METSPEKDLPPIAENGTQSKLFVHSIKDYFFKPDELKNVQIPVKPNETGLDRIKESWKLFAEGRTSPEFSITLNSMSGAGLIGFLVCGLTSHNETHKMHIRQFNDNIFKGQYEANRRLTDTMYLNLFRNGIKGGVRYALFTGMFVGSLTLSATYNNDVRYIPCALASSAVAGIWKANLGLKAVMVSSTAGALFGLAFAAFTRGAIMLTGTSIPEMRYYYTMDDDKIFPD